MTSRATESAMCFSVGTNVAFCKQNWWMVPGMLNPHLLARADVMAPVLVGLFLVLSSLHLGSLLENNTRVSEFVFLGARV
jgi:hypothetical protein